MSKVDVFCARLKKGREEGERVAAYDDATGIEVAAPKGNLTWGRGYYLKKIASPALFDVIDRFIVEGHDRVLSQFGWYNAMDDVRGSVPLDITFNAGDSGYLAGFPKMIGWLARQDWAMAATECRVSNPKLDESRYKLLREILETGVDPTA